MGGAIDGHADEGGGEHEELHGQNSLVQDVALRADERIESAATDGRGRRDIAQSSEGDAHVRPGGQEGVRRVSAGVKRRRVRGGASDEQEASDDGERADGRAPLSADGVVESEVQAHTKIDQGATVTEPNDTRPAKAMRGGRWAHRREGSEAGAGGDAGRPGETSLPVGGVTAEPEPMETGLVGSCVIA